jgi:hypothetical protein
MKNWKSQTSAVLLAAALTPSLRADVVDQQQLVDAARVASGAGIAQAFVPSGNNVSGASVETDKHVAGSGNVTISLWDALPNQSGANMLATVMVPNVPQGQWVNVSWSPVTVTPGNTYFLAFSSTYAFEGFAGSSGNTYPSLAYANNYTALPNNDFAFKTLTQVPEPGTLALFGLGGLALWSLARRRSSR